MPESIIINFNISCCDTLASNLSKRIIETYPGLFSGGSESTFDGEAGFSQKWGWYNSIYALASGSFLKIEEVTKRGLHECLTWLEHEKEKNELERKRLKQ